MNKQELQDELSRHLKAVEELQAKLKEPDNWEPEGGDWMVTSDHNNKFVVDFSDSTLHEFRNNSMRNQTKSKAKELAQHLTNQAILWQLANSLNGDWIPDWSSVSQNKGFVYYCRSGNTWEFCSATVSNETSPTFSVDACKKAIEILNNQDIGIKL